MPLVYRALLGLLLALLPAALVVIQLESAVRRERADQLGEQASRLVRLVFRQNQAVIEGARQTLNAMAAHVALVAEGPRTVCEAFLARLLAGAPRYAGAYVLGADDAPLCATAALSADPAALAPIHEARRLAAFRVGGYADGWASGRPAQLFAAPVPGSPALVVALALSLDWLNEDLFQFTLPEGGAAILADGDNRILARTPDPARFLGQPLPPLQASFAEAPTAGLTSGAAVDGVRRIAAYVPRAENPAGLFVGVGLEAEGAIAAAVAEDRRSALTIIGAMLLTLFVGLLGFHGGVERPVRRLLDATRRWGRRDWSARVGDIGGAAEFRRLGSALDGMAAAVAAHEAARLQANARMEAVQTVAPQIVFTADARGRIDWTNHHWHAVTGQDAASSLGQGWIAALHPEDRVPTLAAWREAVAAALGGGAPVFHREVRLHNAADGGWRWFLLRGAPMRDGDGTLLAWASVGIDFHDLRAAQDAAAESAKQLRTVYDTAPAGLCLLDRALRYIAVNDMLAHINGQPAAAHIGRGLRDMAPDFADALEPLLRAVIESGEPVKDIELRCQEGGQEQVWLCGCFPVRDAEGRVIRVSATMLDISLRKRIEASETRLSHEVDHRAQNALSVVRALVRLSATDTTNIPALVEILEGRIAALSRAHQALAEARWVAVDLGTLLERETAPRRDRVSLEGLSLRLVPEAAQPLTFVMHELMTNALRHGALSRPEGRIAISWRRAEDGGVLLEWSECGGPAPPSEPKPNFGFLLMEANARGQLAGDVAREWRARGLHCTIRIGAEAVAGGGPPEFDAGVLAGRRILLAQDEPQAAAALADVLRDSGCTVIGPATTPEGALDLLDAAGPVDAIVVAGTLQGRSMQAAAPVLARRAALVIYLSPAALAPEALGNAVVLMPPVTALGLRQALARGLSPAPQPAAAC